MKLDNAQICPHGGKQNGSEQYLLFSIYATNLQPIKANSLEILHFKRYKLQHDSVSLRRLYDPLTITVARIRVGIAWWLDDAHRLHKDAATRRWGGGRRSRGHCNKICAEIVILLNAWSTNMLSVKLLRTRDIKCSVYFVSLREEDAYNHTCNMCVFSRIQNRILGLTHKGCVLQRI